MTDALEFEVPGDCSPEHLQSLMEPRRRAWLESSLAQPILGLLYSGTSEDRERLRTEMGAALADAGSSATVVRFGDESPQDEPTPS